MKMLKTLLVTDREAWRAWLAEHHQAEREVWLIWFKKHTGRRGIASEEAVEEALCFGWIDSLIQRIDDDRYARKFTPRINNQNWSELNRKRVAKLIRAGRMTPAGLSKVCEQAAVEHRPSAAAQGSKASSLVPRFVAETLAAHPKARKNFENLAPSYQRLYLKWITSAKREGTQRRRLHKAIGLLDQNKKPGLK